MVMARRIPLLSSKEAKARRNRYLNQFHNQRVQKQVKWKFLGRGGFGTVFLITGKQSETEEYPSEMAVKIAKLTESITLKHEKELLMGLSMSSYPYVIRCYGDEETREPNGERVYNMFLEYCSGGSLKDHIIRSNCGLLAEQVRSYTRDIVCGLAYIHDQGIVHCDIKADNILLAPAFDHGFTAKIADFGLAVNKFLKFEFEENPDFRGTWRYMSPEMVTDKIITDSGDIWSLGCVVVEMITGEPVWGDDDRESIWFRLSCTDEVPEIPDYISEDAKDFLKLCFDKNYLTRSSAETLLQHPFIAVEDC